MQNSCCGHVKQSFRAVFSGKMIIYHKSSNLFILMIKFKRTYTVTARFKLYCDGVRSIDNRPPSFFRSRRRAFQWESGLWVCGGLEQSGQIWMWVYLIIYFDFNLALLSAAAYNSCLVSWTLVADWQVPIVRQDWRRGRLVHNQELF